jgi:LmbE family N-acetylglucosaminyl deacetylase
MDVHDRCRGARVLVLSPHLDDAAFSCGELIAELRRPVVATLFAGVPSGDVALTSWDTLCGFSSGVEAMLARRAEDDNALRMLGALPEQFDFLDHQYGPSPSEQQLSASVTALIGVHRPDVVLLPLGLYHSDHVLLSDAALAAWSPAAWIGYEDVPYRRRPGILQQRLNLLRERGLRATPMAERGKARERKHAAVRAYRSQWRAFGDAGLADTDAPEGYWLLERLE